MAHISEIGWGSYKEYEGPYYRGKCPFVEPQNPTEEEKILAVITSTEGGKYDAINMYDRMILSVGLIQYGEAGQFSVSDILGSVMKKDEYLLKPLELALAISGATFDRNSKGKYRFFAKYGEVDTINEQKSLFLGFDPNKDDPNMAGKLGYWTEQKRKHACTWAAAVATVFENPVAQEVQRAYIVSRIRGFAMPEARKTLWGPTTPQHNEGWAGAIRSIFLSFAANNPAIASEHLHKFDKSLEPFSPEWCANVIENLTFGPKIEIYPTRYLRDVKPVVERLYGVQLPTFEDKTLTAKQVQQILIDLGYDLGPSGADGIMGRKTNRAIIDFQVRSKLKPNGILTTDTINALKSADTLAKTTSFRPLLIMVIWLQCS